jgi:hypothetical protein
MANGRSMGPASGQQLTPAQANMAARSVITSQAVKRTQQIFSETVDLSSRNEVRISPRNAGLILGFIVNVRATYDVADSTGTALTLTPFGPANLLSKIAFDDLNNNTRIDTTGWHMHMVNSARQGRPYLSNFALDNYPISYGDHWRELMEGTATIAQDASGTANASYFVPLAYSDKDLRGGVYANVVNATASLRLTINPNAVQSRTAQGWQEAVYCTADNSTAPADVTENNVTVEVYQVYYDQLPKNSGSVILPMLDLSTIYEIKNTAVQGMVANQDYPIAYSNFRDFLSTVVVYRNRVNDTAGDFGFINETDITRWKLETANYTTIFDVDPYIANMWARQTLQTDPPLGVFYFPTREKPIATNQYGNMNLVLDAADVQTGAAALVGYESFALTNVIGQAGSLTPGG